MKTVVASEACFGHRESAANLECSRNHQSQMQEDRLHSCHCGGPTMQPSIRIHPGPFKPRLSQYEAVINWLRPFDVKLKTIAEAIGYRAGNVRTTCSRWKRSNARVPAPPSLSLAQLEGEITEKPYIQFPSRELCKELGISWCHDYVELRDDEKKELDNLEDEIKAAWARYARENRFAEGFLKMRAYIPRLGRPKSARRIRILARLRFSSAWFLVHSGQASSALDQAMRSVGLWRKAYAESDDRYDLAQVAESALLASMACQLRNESVRSMRWLDLAQSAGEASGQRPVPELFRQRGVVHLQLGQDQEARREFKKAMSWMPDVGDISAATVDMMGTRQINLLDPLNWDKAQDILAESRKVFPEDSLQHSINANWTAAVGIATGSPEAVEEAMKSLKSTKHTTKFFGHQATINELLTATPRLKLSPTLLKRWLRFALYHDAFRDE